jgi:hypothetical protein
MTIRVDFERNEDTKCFECRVQRGFDLHATYFSMPDESRSDFEERIKPDVLEIVGELF